MQKQSSVWEESRRSCYMWVLYYWHIPTLVHSAVTLHSPWKRTTPGFFCEQSETRVVGGWEWAFPPIQMKQAILRNELSAVWSQKSLAYKYSTARVRGPWVWCSTASETCKRVQRRRRVQDYRRKACNDIRCWLYILERLKKSRTWYEPDSGLCELFHPHPAVLAYYQFKNSSLEPMMVKYHSNPPSVHAKETNCHHCCILNIRIIAGS